MEIQRLITEDLIRWKNSKEDALLNVPLFMADYLDKRLER